MLNKPNILIIGGSSFVAKSFISLNKGNYDIKLVSRSKTNNAPEFIIDNFKLIPEELFQGVDFVINCAAVVHQKKELPDSYYQEINYELAVDLAQKAKKNGVKGFIQLSTIAVYGNISIINSETIPCPINAYGSSKLMADKHLLEMADDNFNVSVLRPPMIYGGKNAPGNMMRLIGLVKKGFPLPFKNAIHKKDFLNVHNLVAYMEAAILNNKTNVYLLKDNNGISTFDLIHLIGDKLGKRIIQFSIPEFAIKLIRKFKPEIFDKLYGGLQIDSGKTNMILQINPNKTINEGIDEMVSDFRNK